MRRELEGSRVEENSQVGGVDRVEVHIKVGRVAVARVVGHNCDGRFRAVLKVRVEIRWQRLLASSGKSALKS